MKQFFLLFALCLGASASYAQTSMQGRSVDVRMFGAKCDGSTNDQTAVAAAITAVTSTGGVVNFPDGTCLVTGLTVPGGVTLRGKGREVSIIYSTTNAVIVDCVEGTGAFEFTGPTIENLQVKGSKAAGSSQIAIKMDDGTYYRDGLVKDVKILNAGSHGLYVGNVFSSNFVRIRSDDNAGYPFYVLAPNMPSNRFESLYAGTLNSGGNAGFRIRQGAFYCYTCNGIDGSAAGSAWAIVGDSTGVDGASGNVAAYARWEDCNIESWLLYGIRHYSDSRSDFAGNNIFAGDSSASGSAIAILYQILSATPWSDVKGKADDATTFSNSPASYFANSAPIQSNDLPPLEIGGQGMKIAGGSHVTTFRNTGTSRNEQLYQATGFEPANVITTATSYTLPGPRAFVTNCGSSCQLTLPAASRYASPETITIKNISADGITVTIAANGSETIEGAGNYTMTLQNESVVLYPYAAGSDWKIISGKTVIPGTADYYPIYKSTKSLGASGSLLSNSGGSLLVSAALLFSSDNSVNIGATSSNRPATVNVGTSVVVPRVIYGGGSSSATSGSGSPESSVTAEPGSIYHRTDGTWYLKASGSGNTGWTLANVSGTPSLTATYVGYGNGSNLLTGTSDFAYATASKTLTITNGSGASTLDLAGSSDTNAVEFGAASRPGNQGGIIFPFVGGGNSSGPGIWWASSASYASMSGIYLNNGFTFQGASSTHDPVKIAKGTGTSSNGSVIFEFRPSDAYLALNPFGTSAGDTTPIRFLELAANGTNYFATKAADNIATTRTFVWPNDDPSAGEALTVTSYSGGIITTEWSAVAASLPVVDTTSIVEGSSDNTKEIRFEVDGLTTATVRVLTPQDANYTLAGTNLAQSFTAAQTFAVTGNPVTITQGATTGTPYVLSLTGGAHTSLTGNTEVTDLDFNLSRTITWTTTGGAFATQRSVRFRAPALAGSAATETITSAINVDIDSPAAGSNMTLTDSIALRTKPSATGHTGLFADHQSGATGDIAVFGINGTKIARFVAVNGSVNFVPTDIALSTASTEGFVYLPTTPGVPAGTPTSYTGNSATTVDSTNNDFYFYNSGWKKVPSTASTATWTNKTFDAEATGNVLKMSFVSWFTAAGCNVSSAGPGFDIPATNGPTAACYGTDPQRFGGLDFVDGANALTSQVSFRLPDDWDSGQAIDLKGVWFSSSTSTNNAVFTIATKCVAAGEDLIAPTFNAAQTVTDANLSTANALNEFTQASVTTTGCAAGEMLFVRIGRDPTNGSDTLAATVVITGASLTIRRSM